ncbi:MAG: DEAD/DEAH box helicase family protein [Spirochaeta sp.]|nr:DEAD/DEAH box helicase family protein [Spirochaeta sp.]
MKIKFNPNLRFQAEAISSITDIFEGQEVCRTNFTVAPLKRGEGWLDGLEQNDLGVGNRLRILPEDLLTNVQTIQLRNGLAPSEQLDGTNFTVEMETGTGKTYVYLRTIFELQRRYGFTKFIIVVPSIAIKEGVYKALQMTESHFCEHYHNQQYDYFVYDSQKLGQVRNFATSDYIQIMVINIDAFRKSFDDPDKEDKANIIHRPHDRMTGNKPIEFIQATNPIVIIDEPQSVATTPKSKNAIESLNPLCTLRYSATHVDRYNMMYRLDSVDAYERKLVKQIEVFGIDVEDSHNKAYVKLLRTDNKKSPITAQIELDVQQKDGTIKRTKKTIRSGDDLLEVSGGRSVYDGYIIGDIYCEPDNEYIDFTSNNQIVRLDQSVGGVDQDEYKRLQIRQTVEQHLDKELKLNSQGIKVLSLFFIDRVANYRGYDDAGNPIQGKYARIFEEEYQRAIQKPKYHPLFDEVDTATAVNGVHDGYFAIDKKKVAGASVEVYKESRGSGTTQADESAYSLIMKDKEKLLSFDSKLKFIFSHSALREGWDNPNVFQICTLNETTSTMKKRQEIGRGLRIAVNQDGDRVHGFDVNTLTVMANESYESFASQLQKEIEDEEGIRFGVVDKDLFASMPVTGPDGQPSYFGTQASRNLWDHLFETHYIDKNGKVQDSLRIDLKNNNVDLPPDAEPLRGQINATLRKVSGKLNIKNGADRSPVTLNKAVYLSPEFKALWERIKHRTTFRVDFDPKVLIQECADEMKTMVVGKARFRTSRVKLDIDRGGVTWDDASVRESTFTYGARDFQLPDIISYLQNETNLTRRTLVAILQKSGRLGDFANNPQKFVEQTASIVRHKMRTFIVDGIKYEKIGDSEYYAQELFRDHELFGYLSKNMLESEKSVYDYVVYDSDTEAELAKSFEKSDDVKVYAKLPGWFKIDTPLGSYNPDWAVLVDKDGEEHLYFVVESKGTLFSDDLRPAEKAKIDCGRKHFEALDTDVRFAVANNYDSFAQRVAQE